MTTNIIIIINLILITVVIQSNIMEKEILFVIQTLIRVILNNQDYITNTINNIMMISADEILKELEEKIMVIKLESKMQFILININYKFKLILLITKMGNMY